MSFQVFNVGGSSKSSRLESRKCINKLPVSCRKCVDKLPLNISSPLSYALILRHRHYNHFLTVWPSQTRRMVDLVKLTRLTKTSLYIMTEYRQSTDTSAPTIYSCKTKYVITSTGHSSSFTIDIT
ncbi:hypothetical protein HanXRQr2_Chr04g0142891 [Helianthus annuus]|uniref:Uncharacterized protein n=1 Tax=Helianthus annuus TaxID=4232 RepID=A0A9K3J4F3_HELAN|nr:hypothetical protein HanXRQr2_Chr04g0142891 [Helianthus annuus]KAJ0929546.1 hypothetical protein HanPSC8_Chr04g0138901 [Helianthus annuus]